MFAFIIYCLLLGIVAGFLAGLFGIGGGLVIVPTLIFLLPKIGMPEPVLMSAALGTSFATIVITGFAATQRHHKLGNVVWSAAKYLAPSIMLATFIAGLFIGKLPRDISDKIFACLVVYLAVKMMLSVKSQMKHKPLTPTAAIIGGSLIGVASSAAGIGGGGFIVPFLNARGIQIKQAIGTSSFCGMLLGISGMLSFIIGGWDSTDLPEYSLGYVYMPAVFAVTFSSFFTSKLGATMTTKLPVPILKRCFALLLIIIALKMFFA